MKILKYFLCLIISVIILNVTASAKNKCVPKVYVFGLAASFNDSIVYLTNIQELDSAWIDDKNDFLANRSDYSYQLKNYFESQNINHRTCIVSYALKRKDINKKYQKIKNKYTKGGNFDIRYINNDDFKFSVIKPE